MPYPVGISGISTGPLYRITITKLWCPWARFRVLNLEREDVDEARYSRSFLQTSTWRGAGAITSLCALPVAAASAAGGGVRTRTAKVRREGTEEERGGLPVSGTPRHTVQFQRTYYSSWQVSIFQSLHNIFCSSERDNLRTDLSRGRITLTESVRPSELRRSGKQGNYSISRLATATQTTPATPRAHVVFSDRRRRRRRRRRRGRAATATVPRNALR